MVEERWNRPRISHFSALTKKKKKSTIEQHIIKKNTFAA